MGIKFLCPNGHKLHVKSFLSGKKAICPKCGARVTVPAENQSAAANPSSAADGSSADLLASDVEGAKEFSAIGSAQRVVGSEVSAAQSTVSPPSPSDPIAEAPSAVWYVRPASGGQFGPASGEIMRSWINEGRVGASSLVWRAGWPEWRSAAATFTQLGATLPSPGVAFPATVANGVQSPLPVGQFLHRVVAETPSIVPQGPAVTVPPLVQSVRRRRRNNDVSLLASVILIVISVILVIILIVVWRRQSEPADNETQENQSQTRTMHDVPLAAARG
jgi:hypothetical protein